MPAFPQQMLVTIGSVIAAIVAIIGLTVGISSKVGSLPVGSVMNIPHSVNDQPSQTELTDERKISWTDYEVLDEGKKVRVFFTKGKCSAIRSTVTEGLVSVRIQVMEGSLPGSSGSCTLEGLRASTVVELKNPLNGRLVLQ